MDEARATRDRSRGAQLQRIVGDRGHVYFVPVPDRTHRAVGWYLDVADVDGCDCEFCHPARTGLPAFVAGGAFLAASLLHEYADRHPPAEHQATG